ncbi:MAG: hypothetical protein MI919_34615 [Holophagales bacterium]|nr:hypothetical protein [Holophagales bacterium]
MYPAYGSAERLHALESPYSWSSPASASGLTQAVVCSLLSLVILLVMLGTLPGG